MRPKHQHKDTLGIEALVEIETEAKLHPVPEGVINNLLDFRTSVGLASRGKGYVEVTPELFDQLTQGQETRYICWGTPMVKVYKVGTRDRIDKWENMTIDDKNRTTWEQVKA